MKKQFFIILILLLINNLSFSQSTIFLRFSGIGYHPFSKPNLELYENKIDANGNFNAEPGIILGLEKYIRGNFLSFQITQGMYSDVVAKQAGFTNFSLRRQFYHKYKNHFYITMGASIAYRKDWREIPNYVKDGDFKVNGKWQNKWLFSSSIVYDYYLAKRFDLCFAVMYGYEYHAITPTLGIRFWVNPNVKVDECDCTKRFDQGRLRKWFKIHFR